RSARSVRELSLGLPSTARLPTGQAHALTAAARAASVGSFHLAMGVAAALVALGGLCGAIGIRNERGAAVPESTEPQFVGDSA
ncbi:MAG: hypothetical protein ACYCYN_12590, partial [Solirubrobacteraceae bacterium]